VVGLGDASAAEGAVFAASRFGEGASAAGWGGGWVWWMVERVVVGVARHCDGVVGGGDGGDAGAGEVEEDIGDSREEDGEDAVEEAGEEGPSWWNKKDLGNGEEEDEEDLERRVMD
jgi:hypothetical protein